MNRPLPRRLTLAGYLFLTCGAMLCSTLIYAFSGVLAAALGAVCLLAGAVARAVSSGPRRGDVDPLPPLIRADAAPQPGSGTTSARRGPRSSA